MFCQKIVFDTRNKNRVYLLTFKALLSAGRDGIHTLLQAENLGMFTNVYMDNANRMWLTGTGGLFQYADSVLTPFNPENGYEGSKTSAIFQDRESNIWFGTNGTGVFRYSNQPFLIFDQFAAARNSGIMPMMANQGRLYLGTEGSGLFMVDGKKYRMLKGFPKIRTIRILSEYSAGKTMKYMCWPAADYLQNI